MNHLIYQLCELVGDFTLLLPQSPITNPIQNILILINNSGYSEYTKVNIQIQPPMGTTINIQSIPNTISTEQPIVHK